MVKNPEQCLGRASTQSMSSANSILMTVVRPHPGTQKVQDWRGEMTRESSHGLFLELMPTRQSCEGQNHFLLVAAILMTSRRSPFPLLGGVN